MAAEAGRRQRGVNLVALMVGTALLTASSLVLMAAYRSVVSNSVTSTKISKTGAESSSGLLAVLQSLQQAGWGAGAAASPPGGAVNTNLVLLSGATLASQTLSGTAQAIAGAATAGNALVWDTRVSGSTQCTALLSTTGGGVVMLGPVACAQASAWAGLSWTAATTLVSPATPAPSFNAQKTACWPFQLAPVQAALLPSFTQVSVAGLGSASPAICLLNLRN